MSLTFDDGDANQMSALSMLQSHGMVGTFYIITGYVGASGYLTQDQIGTIAAAGNEIGGHTVTHPDLTTLPNDEVERQVCESRNTLASWGYQATSFAYPFADTNDTDESIVESCGYNSARMLGDIASRFGCADCGAAERFTPRDPYYLKALDQVDSTWTLEDLQTAVTNAEKKGGWLIYTFHNICDNSCGDPSISPALFDEFLTWLQSREATDNLSVQTVNSVIGGTVKPLVTPPAPPAPVDGVNGVQNPGFEDGSECWYQAGYGTNTAELGIGTPAHTGTQAGQVTITEYTDGDAKWLQSFDLGGCAPAVTSGETYSLRAWYQSTAVTQFAVYLRDSSGAWSYWTSSPWFAPSATWSHAVWTTPVIPDGVTGISFGLNLFSVGTLSVDDVELYNTVGAPDPDASTPPDSATTDDTPSDSPATDSASSDATSGSTPAIAPLSAPATDPSSTDPASTDTSSTDPSGGTGSAGTGSAASGSASSDPASTGTDDSASSDASGDAAPADPGTPSTPPATPPAAAPTPPAAPAEPAEPAASTAPADPGTAPDAGTTSAAAPANTDPVSAP